VTTNINVDLVMKSTGHSQESIVKWCFDNLKPFSWGIKFLSGMTHVYFDNSMDAENFAEHWGVME
jgi:hypothetical protein